MNESTGLVTVPEVDRQVNIFQRVKARHLIGWLFAAFPLFIIFNVYVTGPLWQTIAVDVWVYGVPIIWYFVRVRPKGLELRSLRGHLPQSRKWLFYVLLNVPVFMLSIGSIIVIYSLISRVAPHVVEDLLSKPVSEVQAVVSNPLWTTVLELFGALVLAPIVEEFIFRGFLLHRFTEKWRVAKAIIMVSIIFGVLHINFFGAAAFSVVLCVVYLYTKSIWPSVFLHFINNVVSSWPTHAPSDGGVQAADLQQSYIAGWVFVIIALPILIWFIKKHWPKKDVVLPYFSYTKVLE